ncbi:MAG TPA: hypothetical protein P5119_08185 [Candidatus Aminicenantes bacterium]|nr:hypothetical protein [Candidatus Aminicenantes bacterium]HRY65305.1 hypothetical protein [Candidatus Aminicenantes bacterium]HRZ72227.1 hypothetical protein [Candidatus Aminicenantes bacterium]
MKESLRGPAVTALGLYMLAVPGTLSARPRRGSNLVVTLKDGRSVEGELIAVKPDSLLLFSDAAKDESVDLAGISSIRIIRKSKAGLGAICGLLAGVAGTVIYASAQKETEDPWIGLWQGIGVMGAGVMFIGSGLGLGIVAGLLAGKDKTIRLEGMSESEVARAMAYLRGKARIRDFGQAGPSTDLLTLEEPVLPRGLDHP